MKRHLASALGYLGSGGIAALVDIGGFAGLHALGCGVIVADVSSFLIAAMVNTC